MKPHLFTSLALACCSFAAQEAPVAATKQPGTKEAFAHLREGDAWVERSDVWIKLLNRKGDLTVGYGSLLPRVRRRPYPRSGITRRASPRSGSPPHRA